MMRWLKYQVLFCVLLLPFTIQAQLQQYSSLETPSLESFCVDSIMNNVYFYAPYYKTAIAEYDADLYVKTNIDIQRKNFLMRYIPQMFRPQKGVDKYVLETYSDVHYTAPDIYDQRVKAITGTTPRLKGSNPSVLRYFTINIYSTSFLNTKLISPIQKEFAKYYRYKIEQVYLDANNKLEFKISFVPKSQSYQLIEGYFIVSNDVWSIREVSFYGRSEYLSVQCYIRLGEVGTSTEFLPLKHNIDVTFRFLWNKIRNVYQGAFKYDKIQPQLSVQFPTDTVERKSKYNLTESYSFQFPDTVKIEREYDNFYKFRLLPLQADEAQLYTNLRASKDSIQIYKDVTKKNKSAIFWGEVGDFLVSNYTLNLYEVGSVKFSPILNPFLLSYNGRDGISYKLKIKYNRLFKNDRLLRIYPTLGYNFKYKEFYWKTFAHFNYWPQKRLGIEINTGNGNRIYSSEVLDDLKGQTDTIDFKKLNLNYFKNLHFDVMHTWEVVNGLHFDIGLSASRRVSPRNNLPDSLNLDGRFNGRYVSVAPRVRTTWTPGQYYYMNGYRKINLYSKYPTFIIDWERGIKGFMGATGSHERLEMNIQHKLALTMMKNLYYRFGGGVFSNQDQMYFVDFVYFAKNNLPEGWNDDIGGTFQLLGREWFNASQWYLRANFVYESPFILLPHIKKYTRSVINERLYLNHLVMNQMHPYMEVGYGIGTHIFDFGVFGALANWNNTKIGCKITFELFNR